MIRCSEGAFDAPSISKKVYQGCLGCSEKRVDLLACGAWYSAFRISPGMHVFPPFLVSKRRGSERRLRIAPALARALQSRGDRALLRISLPPTQET
jgi:hypothetical protein